MKSFHIFTVILLGMMPQAIADSLKVDFNGNDYGSVIAQTQAGFGAYNARNETSSDFIPVVYTAFGTAVTITPTWAAGTEAAAQQSWNRGNGYGYSTAAGDMLDLVIDWIGTDQRYVGDPMTLTVSGLPTGTYTWRSYHHDTQNQAGHFSATVNDATGSLTTSGLQVSNSQSLSDLTLADVTKFETQIVSDGVHPVSLVFEATDTPEYYTFFVMNGFEISDGQADPVWRSNAPLRRQISPEQPMWLVHIDTWNYADPQKIIALIPQDIRPFVVMNISLSISHDVDTSRFQVAEYGYEVAKSWLRACAENRMWAMVQPSSGGFSQFSDFDLSVYEEFFRDYPNMIGFNYCEQFWGYDSTTDPLSAAWTDRINHFANLLELCDRYGGFLVVSWCGNQWSPPINPMGMLKRVPAFASACREYTDNYILCEKYTQQSYQSDMESLCLGAYLSGYSGQYGIRYDDTGWTDANGNHANFTMATGGAPHLEHIMLTGMTVIDAPELIWTQCFREISAGATSNGYMMRRWQTFPQFDNVSVDIFRKILDGTVRIPSRQEVINRTKVVILNDVNYGGGDDIYSTPATLFEGLYRMDGDGNLRDNKTFFKKTGRYPTVPTVFQLGDALANTFAIQVNKSAYSTRWPTVASKVDEFNSLFPEEYTGDIYAGRHENGWVIYNPYKTGQAAGGSISFKYNTCDRVELSLSQYTAGVMKEYPDRVTFYLSNFDNVLDTGLKTDVIKIHGSTSKPAYSWQDRASHQSSMVTDNWAGGVFTLTVQHNGPLDISINCAGTAINRLTEYTPAVITAPAKPLTYTGPVQYEAECFDYKDIAGIVGGGYPEPVRNYTGQGYLRFGTDSAAAVRDTATVLKNGTYRLETRYSVTGSDINSVDLYVNGVFAAAPMFAQTPSLSEWAVDKQNIILNAGANTIEFRARGAGASSIYFDSIVIVPTVFGDGVVIQENRAGFSNVDGAIGNVYPEYTGDGYADTDDCAGAGITWSMDFTSSAVKSFTFRYACPDNRTADLIVNNEIVVSDIQFRSTGSWSAWDYVTVYTGTDPGPSDVALKSFSDLGLPNIDCVEIIGILPLEPPVAPTGLLAAAVSDGRINLSWTVTSNAASYNIKRSNQSGGPYSLIANLTGAGFSDTGLSESTTYYYVVSAVNSAGESADSSQVSATTVGVPPAAPAGLAASPADGLVALTWDAGIEDDLAGYNVYRSTVPAGGYVLQNGSLLTSPEFADNAVVNGMTYYYAVTAVDTRANESGYSVRVSAVPNDGSTVQLSAVDFESWFGNWLNVTDDDTHDWLRDSGGTLTPNTGPDNGALDSTWYAYLETSPGGASGAGDTAILQSPVIGGLDRMLTFHYHMYGQDTGTLYVDVYDGIWHYGVWSLDGQQHSSSGDEYGRVTVDMREYTGPLRIRLRAVAAGGPRGDMAVDAIEVSGRMLYGDMDGDQFVTLSDLSAFAEHWLMADCGLDLDGDCVITLTEFAELAGNWFLW